MSSDKVHILSTILGIITLGDKTMNYNKESDDFCYYVARVNIKKYRKKMGITSQELADRSGFTHQFIRNLESLKSISRPRLDTLYRIAKFLEVDLKQLFDEVD